MRKISILFSLFLLIACQTKQAVEVDQNLVKPKNYQAPEIVFSFDDIRSPAFSDDGKFLAFVHWHAGLKDPQIFEYNLTTNTLRQITHQVGRITEVKYLPNRAGLIYTSTTDEDKENPSFLRSFLYPDENREEVLNTEIYTMRLNGSDIRRYTNSPGFDGYMTVHPTTNVMVYSSKRGPFYQLKKSTFNGSDSKTISAGKWEDKLAKFSPNGNSLVWLRETEGQKRLLLSPAKFPLVPKDITPEAYDIFDFDWHPDSSWLVFSAKEKEKSYFQLYLYNISTGCIVPITIEAANAMEPSFHPGGKAVYYVIEQESKYRLLKTENLSVDSCTSPPVK